MSKYIVSPITTYDEWDMVFVTKVYKDTGERPLRFAAMGQTADKSRAKAEWLANKLNSLKRAKNAKNGII